MAHGRRKVHHPLNLLQASCPSLSPQEAGSRLRGRCPSLSPGSIHHGYVIRTRLGRTFCLSLTPVSSSFWLCSSACDALPSPLFRVYSRTPPPILLPTHPTPPVLPPRPSPAPCHTNALPSVWGLLPYPPVREYILSLVTPMPSPALPCPLLSSACFPLAPPLPQSFPPIHCIFAA